MHHGNSYRLVKVEGGIFDGPGSSFSLVPYTSSHSSGLYMNCS